MRAAPPVLVALLLASPLACAAADVGGLAARFEAETLSATGGGSTAAQLAALVIAAAPDREGPAPEAGAFVLRAGDLTVEADLHTYGYDLVATTDIGTRTTHARPYGSAEVRSDDARAGYTLAVLPTGPTVVQTRWTSFSIAPSPLDRVSVTNQVNNTPARRIEAATPNSLGLDVVGAPASLSLRGDFRVALWFWNATVVAPDRPDGTLEWSGEVSQPLAEGAGPTAEFRRDVRRQQIILDVRDGVLEFSRPPQVALTLLAREARSGGGGEWTLRGAEGALGDGDVLRPARAGEVVLQGALEVEAATDGRRVQADIHGEVESARLDGVPAPWAVTVAQDGSRWSGAWMLAVGGLALAPAAAWSGQRARRRLEQRRLEALELSMGLGDYEAVVRGAPRLARTAFAHDATTLQVEALLRLGRLDQARALAEAQTGWDGPSAANLDLVRGLVAAHAGHREEAVAHVSRALQAAPEFRSEVMRRPAFASLRDDPRLRPLLRGRGDARARTSMAYA